MLSFALLLIFIELKCEIKYLKYFGGIILTNLLRNRQPLINSFIQFFHYPPIQSVLFQCIQILMLGPKSLNYNIFLIPACLLLYHFSETSVLALSWICKFY